MALSLTDIFGAGATIDDSTPTDPILQIKLTNLQNDGTGDGEIEGGFGINDATLINSTNGDSYGHKILAALILLHYQNQLSTNTDPTVGTYINYTPSSDKRFVSRGDTAQVEYRPTVNIYTDDPTTQYDPDNVKNA